MMNSKIKNASVYLYGVFPEINFPLAENLMHRAFGILAFAAAATQTKIKSFTEALCALSVEIYRESVCFILTVHHLLLERTQKFRFIRKLDEDGNLSNLDPLVLADIRSIAENATSLREFLADKKGPAAGAEEAADSTVLCGISFCQTMKNLGEALESAGRDKNLAKTMGKTTLILTHAPLVGIAFVALRPVLESFVKAGKVEEEIPKTLERISTIANELKKSIERIKNLDACSDEAQTDFRDISDLLNDGMNCLRKTMKRSNKKRLSAAYYANDNRTKLKTWNERADTYLADTANVKTIANYHMISLIAGRKLPEVYNLSMMFAIFVPLFYLVMSQRQILRALNTDSRFGHTWIKEAVCGAREIARSFIEEAEKMDDSFINDFSLQ